MTASPYPTFPYPSSNHLPSSLAEAIDATPPGHDFADRELLNVIRVGLSRIYASPYSETSSNMREAARQALARLERRTSLDSECECCVSNECECVTDADDEEVQES